MPLTIEFFHANLCLHYFALNYDNDANTSKVSHIQEGRGETDSDSLAPTHKAALGICIDSLHGILTAFTAFAPQDIRTLPTSVFARVAYATILLIKLYLAASLQSSKLGTVIADSKFHLADRIAGLIDLLRASAENGKSRPAHNFSLVMAMLQVWYQKQINDRANAQNAAVEAEPEHALQNGESRTASKQPEHRHHKHAPSALGQTPLHLLSEVAMGNSGSTNSGHQVPNGSDSSSGQPNTTNAYKADFYPPSMVGDGLRRMHPGFEQALGMTLQAGELGIGGNDGFFDLMQRTSEIFEGGGG